jgi:hypothetical protein
MSGPNYEAAGPEAYDPADYEDSEGGLDPFDEGFGEQLGQTITEAVTAGIGEAIGSYAAPLLPDAAPAEYDPGFDAVDLTPEQTAALDEAVDAAFDTLEATVGEFDRAEAFAEAERLFVERLQADPEGMIAALEDDSRNVAEEIFAAGARVAAETGRGQAYVDDLTRAERVRVGSDVNPRLVQAAADEALNRLVESGIEPTSEVAAEALTAAASMVSGVPRFKPGPRSTENIAHYYAARIRADKAMDARTARASQPRPAGPAPGQYQTPQQLAQKHSQIMKRGG